MIINYLTVDIKENDTLSLCEPMSYNSLMPYIEWLNDCMVLYVEKDAFAQVPNIAIMQYCQNMKIRKK